jgi:hypothetical protein
LQAQTIYLQTQILEKDLANYEESLLETKDRLIRIREDFKTEKLEPKKSMTSSVKETSMQIRNRLEMQNNLKVRLKLIFTGICLKLKRLFLLEHLDVSAGD